MGVKTTRDNGTVLDDYFIKSVPRYVGGDRLWVAAIRSAEGIQWTCMHTHTTEADAERCAQDHAMRAIRGTSSA